MVSSKVVGQQADEADEKVLDSLRHDPKDNGTALRVLQVEKEHGIEHTQDFALW